MRWRRRTTGAWPASGPTAAMRRHARCSTRSRGGFPPILASRCFVGPSTTCLRGSPGAAGTAPRRRAYHPAPHSFTDSWTLRQWSGDDVPGLPGTGTLDGTLFGGTAIVRIPQADGSSSLGVTISNREADRLSGTIALLPSTAFQGRIEAIETAEIAPAP